MAVSLKDPQDGGINELSEINVTPFIDVMLVLLIIFMVAAPLSTVDVAVDLPVSNAQPQPRPDKPVFLTIKQDLTLVLGNEDVPRTALQATLDQQTGNDREQRVFLRADGAVAYDELMKVMNLLRDAGYLKIALVGLEDTGQAQAAGGTSGGSGAPVAATRP
jgi:biopolymer transport protein ExbD